MGEGDTEQGEKGEDEDVCGRFEFAKKIIEEGDERKEEENGTDGEMGAGYPGSIQEKVGIGNGKGEDSDANAADYNRS